MFFRYAKSVYCWLLETVEVARSWFWQHTPAAWERGLDTLQQLTAGSMKEAGHVQMRRGFFIVGTVLVVYLVASSTLMQLLVVLTLALGVILVLHKTSSVRLQETPTITPIT